MQRGNVCIMATEIPRLNALPRLKSDGVEKVVVVVGVLSGIRLAVRHFPPRPQLTRLLPILFYSHTILPLDKLPFEKRRTENREQ